MRAELSLTILAEFTTVIRIAFARATVALAVSETISNAVRFRTDGCQT